MYFPEANVTSPGKGSKETRDSEDKSSSSHSYQHVTLLSQSPDLEKVTGRHQNANISLDKRKSPSRLCSGLRWTKTPHLSPENK
ncbi:hypothetical protein STEG23_034193, partial [Scotinomys teguina]